MKVGLCITFGWAVGFRCGKTIKTTALTPNKTFLCIFLLNETMNVATSKKAKKATKKEEKINLGIGIFILTLIFAIMSNIFDAPIAIYGTISSPLYSILAKIVLVVISGIMYGGSIFLFSYSIYLLLKFRENAIRVCQLTIALLLFLNLIIFAIGNFVLNLPDLAPIEPLIGVIIYSVICLPYLTFSKGVKKRYPPQERKIYSRDKIIITLVFASLPALVLAQIVLPEMGEIRLPETYEECLGEFGVTYCNEGFYEICLEALDDPAYCREYKACLDTRLDRDYCDSEFFEFVDEE